MSRVRPFGWRVWLAVSVALAILVSAGLAVQRWRRPREVPMLGAATETIAPGVHMLRGLGPSVAYVVETSEGPILIDSGLESDAAPLKAEMAKLLLDWRSIKAVLLTHVHGDHCGGAEHLHEATGAKIHAGRGDAAVLRAGTPREAFFSAFYMPNHSPHKTTVDVELIGGEDLVFGDTHIRAVGTPGHTPGSICYLLERGGKRILFTGDVIMHLGDETPLGTYSAYLSPGHRGDATTYLASIRELRKLPAPDLVLPGHPPLGTRPDDPRMTPERWAAMMDQGIRDMETLLARYAADGADFLDGEPKVLLPGLAYLGDYDGASVYAMMARGKLIVANAPGGAGLADFISKRARSLGLEPTSPSAVLLTSLADGRSSGLKELVAATHAEVFASRDGLDAARASCPPGATVSAAEDLLTRALLDVKVITLKGADAPVAYVLRVTDKTVVLTGRMPAKIDEESMATLTKNSSVSRETAIDDLMSIQKLDALTPDLWLPAIPWHGQNANLYGDEWQELIDSNYRIEHFLLRRSAAPANRSDRAGN